MEMTKVTVTDWCPAWEQNLEDWRQKWAVALAVIG
jgi:hypothetical protein